MVNLVQKGFKKISPFFIPYAITNMGGALLAIDQVRAAHAGTAGTGVLRASRDQAWRQEQSTTHDCCLLPCTTHSPQGFMGPNYSISTACATANYAFVSAANHIRNGDADVMVVSARAPGARRTAVLRARGWRRFGGMGSSRVRQQDAGGMRRLTSGGRRV